jgi:DNA-binding CsgD family transcriptional regulator
MDANVQPNRLPCQNMTDANGTKELINITHAHQDGYSMPGGAFAEFERAMLKERTKAGLDMARRDGRIGGRRPKLSSQQQAEIIKMVSKGIKTGADAARLFKIHPATVSRLLARVPRLVTARAK